MMIKTSDKNATNIVLGKVSIPEKISHKGQNGKLLIIGGSSLFHSASIWAAEVASHFVDMVHYSSTEENQKIFLHLKKIFRNGIIIRQENLDEYIHQDDAILVGPGMMREGNEGKMTRKLVKKLIEEHPEKKYVFDAGALQTMEAEWLTKLQNKAIITPHAKEFESMFGVSLSSSDFQKNRSVVKKISREFNAVVIMKSVIDYVSDGKKSFEIEGGNQGLTKGGTGDLLSGLAASFLTKIPSFDAAAAASFLLKKTGDELFKLHGYWYNIDDIIKSLGKVLKQSVLK